MHRGVEPGDDDRSERNEGFVVLEAMLVAAGQDRFRETAGADVREAFAECPFEEPGELIARRRGRIGCTKPE